MSRSVPEWVGKTDDEQVPTRVRVRVFERDGGHCQICTRKIGPADKWVCDHVQSLINGGENREANLQTICDWCDRKVKTPADVAIKAKTAARKAKHTGAKRKRPWHPTLRKKLNGEVVER